MKETAVLAPGIAGSITPSVKDRLDSVDLLRGFVMVVMALDHTRDYFHHGAIHGGDPLDLKTTTLALFLTRWITHFCAPTFMFLAGTGAFLSSTRGKSKRALSWFLLSRGLWLILLELTYFNWAGWSFAIDLHLHPALVIWALGWSMIVLAALVHLPLRVTAAIGLLLILGHNALDGVNPKNWGALGWLWQVLHVPGPLDLGRGYSLFVLYPLIPWVGVMAVGYAFGSILTRPRTERRPWVLRLGVGLTIAFVALRFTNAYGDAHPWSAQKNPVFTVLSFLDCVKYPPSLCYLLMTLGPALIVLALLDREKPPAVWKPLLAFGRVPMFYYLLHLPLIHGLAVLLETIRFGSAPWLFGFPIGPKPEPPPAAGINLAGVYLVWLAVIVMLYPLCRWFAELKRRRREVWMSYF